MSSVRSAFVTYLVEQMIMRYRNQDPYILKTRYNSVCAETGKAISKGDEAIYYPNGRKIFHVDSKTASDFRSAQFDRNYLGADY